MEVDGEGALAGATGSSSSKVKTEFGEEGGAAAGGGSGSEKSAAPAGAGGRVKVESSPAVGKGAGKLKAEGAESAGGDGGAVLAMALLLIRHAMQDTFGKAAVTVVSGKKMAAAAAAADKRGSSAKTPFSAEIKIDIDGAVARLRVLVIPPPLAPPQRMKPDLDGPAAGEAAWRCEMVECTRDSLRSQIMLLVERLRAAVAKS